MMRAIAELIGTVVIFFALYKGVVWMVANIRAKDGVKQTPPTQ